MDQLATDFLGQQTGSTAAWIGGISVAIFIIVKIKKAVAAAWPFVKKFIAVVEDLFGAEARPGVAARPGLMARMQTSEEADAKITAALEDHSETLKELQPNHGGSMKDVLNEALRAITRQGERTDDLEEALRTHIEEQRAATTNAEASAVNAATAVTNAEASAANAATAVTNAEASAANAAHAATDAATAATGAAAAVVGAQAAVVGAQAAVVGAEAAVVAATKDRKARADVHVNVAK